MRPLLRPLTFLLTLAACNPELQAVQERQRALSLELATLDSRIDDLERQLDQPVPADPHAPLALGARWVRTGPSPALDATPHERAGGVCGHRIRMPSLRSVSDYQLVRAGQGRVSPVTVTIDGTALRAHATPADFQDRCAGAFRHAGTAVLFSPPSNRPPAAVDVGLDAHPFVVGPDGDIAFWIYPGQTGALTTSNRWRADWGPAVVEHDLWSTKGSVAPTVDGVRIASGDSLQGSGPWTLSIRAPDDAFVRVRRLTIGTPPHRLELTPRLVDSTP